MGPIRLGMSPSEVAAVLFEKIGISTGRLEESV
ncbi:hypothetical protein N181_18410 [Sinorhizobium fredii USDA 205]|nr:hypothetical protein N181_18410 [Sinorhizobium fredii USDA 205]